MKKLLRKLFGMREPNPFKGPSVIQASFIGGPWDGRETYVPEDMRVFVIPCGDNVEHSYSRQKITMHGAVFAWTGMFPIADKIKQMREGGE